MDLVVLQLSWPDKVKVGVEIRMSLVIELTACREQSAASFDNVRPNQKLAVCDQQSFCRVECTRVDAAKQLSGDK